MDEPIRQGDYDTAWELEELREGCERAKASLDVLDRHVEAIQGLVWAFAFGVRVLGIAMLCAAMWWAAHALAALLP